MRLKSSTEPRGLVGSQRGGSSMVALYPVDENFTWEEIPVAPIHAFKSGSVGASTLTLVTTLLPPPAFAHLHLHILYLANFCLHPKSSARKITDLSHYGCSHCTALMCLASSKHTASHITYHGAPMWLPTSQPTGQQHRPPVFRSRHAAIRTAHCTSTFMP